MGSNRGSQLTVINQKVVNQLSKTLQILKIEIKIHRMSIGRLATIYFYYSWSFKENAYFQNCTTFYELNSSKSYDQIFKNMTFLKILDKTPSYSLFSPSSDHPRRRWGNFNVTSVMPPLLRPPQRSLIYISQNDKFIKIG